MAVNYGATSQVEAPLGGGNDVDDSDDGDEVDYLQLTEVDEDYFDDDDAADDSFRRVQRRIPFTRIHDDPIPFDSSKRHCFLPGQRIRVEIIRWETDRPSHLLRSNLYTIQVVHGEYKWTIQRRHKHFRAVHDSLVVVRAKAKLSLTSKDTNNTHGHRRNTSKKQSVPKFPTRPDQFVHEENLEQRKNQLEAFLQAILKYPPYRNHPQTLAFLEVCQLSFVNGLGLKSKEGLIEKRTGGRRVALGCCMCLQPGRWQKRWVIVKDTFVAYIRPEDGAVKDVILMDGEFSVKSGLTQTGFQNGLLISNLSRHLLLRCWTERNTRDWCESIEKTVKKFGEDYVEKNRYASFAPVRPNSYVNWFVDGASYMAAVADGMESAKEEIFITDWMLSPELYMKRPAIEGEKWRLDKILERKANEGVKVFILIYKEMEMALGISSYYTKSTLVKLNPTNIKVMRHPDGISFWSHHEKSVVIDQRIAFLGGIDLCYGRWDTRTHRLSDLSKSQLTQFYGREDLVTLRDLFKNISGIVVPESNNNSNKSNNNLDDDAASVNPHQPPNGPVSPAAEQLSKSFEGPASAAAYPDDSGGYVNDGLDVVAHDDDNNHEDADRNAASVFKALIGRSRPEVTGDDVTGRLQNTGSGTGDDGVPASDAASEMPGYASNADVDLNKSTSEVKSDQGDTSTMQMFLDMLKSRPNLIADQLSKVQTGSTNQIETSEHSSVSHAAATAFESSRLPSTEPETILTDEQRSAMFGVTRNKPTTPILKTKNSNKMKTIVDMKMLFVKHKPESMDVTDDTAAKPWDESVYNSKEQGKDAEFDAKLAQQGLCGPLKIWVGKDYVNFIFKDFVDLDSPFTDNVDRTVTPRMPWHDMAAVAFGKPARDVARHFIQRWNFTKLEKKKASLEIPMLLPKSNSLISVPRWAASSAFTCNCQILRSSSEWSAGIKTTETSIYNAYIDLILTAKHFIYIENQFFVTIDKDNVVRNRIGTALFERILQAHRNNETFRVYVVMPLLPAFEGEIGTTTGMSIQAVTYWNYSSICRGGKSLLERLVAKGVANPFKYISFCGLRKHEEMCGSLVTELVYVHSKLMIVDDCSVIIASANINDRSMLGSRDSELGIVVQDTITVDSVMNGKPYKAGAFACSLRKSLFREHLGVNVENPYVDVTDPVSTEIYENVWLRQASINTKTFEKVFCCVPTDEVRTLQQLKEYQQRPLLAHTDPAEARKQLQKIKGFLVLLPLQFLASENLAPPTATKEGLAPTIIWT